MRNAKEVLIDEYIQSNIHENLTADEAARYRKAYKGIDEESHDAATQLEAIVTRAAFTAGIKAALELIAK